jgi:hypothetical protein
VIEGGWEVEVVFPIPIRYSHNPARAQARVVEQFWWKWRAERFKAKQIERFDKWVDRLLAEGIYDDYDR